MSPPALGPLLVALVLVLGGCSEDPAPGPATTDSSRSPGKQSSADAADGGNRRKGGPHQLRRSGGQDLRTTRPGDASDASRSGPGASDGKRRPDGRTAASDGIATASASRSDPVGDGDRQGDTPGHADIRRARVTGRGETVRFSLTVDGAIPRSGTEEGVDMTASFHLRMRGGDEHQIYALGRQSGWRADFDNSGEFPGRFALEGDTFVFELPWERLGGAAAFKWLAQTSWTRSPEGPLDDTDFAFDQAPEYETARYPE